MENGELRKNLQGHADLGGLAAINAGGIAQKILEVLRRPGLVVLVHAAHEVGKVVEETFGAAYYNLKASASARRSPPGSGHNRCVPYNSLVMMNNGFISKIS